ncbi:uncharacterized protein BDV14DRAFT_206035 [Aspergillus stella-maris]|uniref:uncharacterized protein n=1 Tax=Aspergillus stella-maris TaxID=1810926 RepID=UPI003CCDEC24
MHFRITAALATAILASPLALALPQTDVSATTEDVSITNFSATKSSGSISSVSFTLSGVSCTAENPSVSYDASAATQCGSTNYWFNIVSSSDSSFAVSVINRLDVEGSGYFSAGQYGVGYVPASCNGDVCSQSGGAVIIYLTGQ